jgi:arsenate reductase
MGTKGNNEVTLIWHNPKCSKSRQTLALLREQGIEPEIVEYLKHSPSAAKIAQSIKALGIEARDLMRKGEALYKELNLKDIKAPEDLIDAMADHPILIERPIVFHNGKAAIGRPPENILKILD